MVPTPKKIIFNELEKLIFKFGTNLEDVVSKVHLGIFWNSISLDLDTANSLWFELGTRIQETLRMNKNRSQGV